MNLSDTTAQRLRLVGSIATELPSVDPSDMRVMHYTEAAVKLQIPAKKLIAAMRRKKAQGMIGPLRAPRACAADGSTGKDRMQYTTAGEVRRYREQRERFEKLFLDPGQLCAAIGLSTNGAASRATRDHRPLGRLRQHEVYGQVEMPKPFVWRGHSGRRLTWHTEDVDLFVRFIAAQRVGTNGEPGGLAKTPAFGWCEERKLWRPLYPMPLDEDFAELVKPETIEAIAEMRARAALPQSA